MSEPTIDKKASNTLAKLFWEEGLRCREERRQEMRDGEELRKQLHQERGA